MKGYEKIDIELGKTKMSIAELYEYYGVDEYNDPQDLLISRDKIILTLYKKIDETK
ncbi:MAG: hypothetical protein KIC47_03375 [Clostridium sp.]|uniref:hypothetical protein n=1 Tax=Clostridium neonatale TaxID=137838 RepID=UPI001DABEF58|nr:hypothetical protein [Clostridium neonatale]MBS5949351.1 hypothetical protein [Clostridium sp.]CAI3539534.1 conserved hypothetical protein [Clostridium neonatale]CAI3606791.1 conserved hypothetical protein [Clostridium neonatale]